MKELTIKGKSYQFISDFKDNDALRGHFNELTQKVYDFNFEDWYQNGYWGERYIPYSLLDNDTMVSNVSVNVIDFLAFGDKRTYIQIGTVMTDPEYRNRGLNKALLEKVLEDWRGKCDLIYLFANDTVLDFYPKFGFKRVDEYQHSKNISHTANDIKPQKLDMALESNRDLVIKKINTKAAISQVSMIGNSDLVMFYLTWFMSGNVYYLEEHDAIVIAEYQNDVLYLQDIFCEESIELDEVMSTMANENTKEVVLGFTPKDSSSFEEKIHTPDDVLFILNDKWKSFKDAKVLFPVLSHA